jgi:hypothetical protein
MMKSKKVRANLSAVSTIFTIKLPDEKSCQLHDEMEEQRTVANAFLHSHADTTVEKHSSQNFHDDPEQALIS